MKRVFVGLLAISLLATACNNDSKQTTAATTVNAAEAPKFKFDNEAYDFGKIISGAKVTHEFKFTNEGKTPLVITNAIATCGCTVPEWPKAPVKPGESGVIKLTFDSAAKVGLQDKQVTITANTVPATTVVHLIGEVLEKK
ncbi:DUF1573 domain-containing protein [Mucilaginibacter myungsuensis]|uniref:DUF1573 domain-containing protein n=1 Tax=Mucilaginibacter myungsuensis TaxID=649104 RepID=A0A929PW66_9SPHI|nr:DUF1573 domain-containing protein [Mucilaginibacter myungsuensis]MBE9662508.1 DUF1573 domain-containing protein [Mucilaginibacter myungsuensis]MDN3597927.1 DUF1573 domain-containing protein [Mucilaginibacter myungsuensis]